MPAINLKDYIRDIPDFPKPGILFRDISPLLENSDAFNEAIKLLASQFSDIKIDSIAAVEARGFIFGAAVAMRMGISFVPIRKAGKLPYKTNKISYDLEYGQDTLEVHQDAFENNKNVLIIDDLLATGGTLGAACALVEKSGATIVGISCLIELKDLEGRAQLANYDFRSIIKY